MHVSSLYSTYVSALMQTESKRQSANQIYLSISLAIITASSSIETFPSELAGGMICFVSLLWIGTILSYRALARAKFAVIDEMEESFEFKPYRREWDLTPPMQKIIGLTYLEAIAPLITLCGAIFFLIL